MYYNINGDLYVYILPDQLNIQCYNLQEIYHCHLYFFALSGWQVVLGDPSVSA